MRFLKAAEKGEPSPPSKPNLVVDEPSSTTIKQTMMRFGKLFLKPAAEGQPFPLKLLFPLSLSYPLPTLVDEGCPMEDLTTKKTAIKLCDFGLLCRHIFVGIVCAYVTKHYSYRWFLRWSLQGKNGLFNKLRSYVKRLHPFQFITSQIHLAKWRWGRGGVKWENLPLDLSGEIGKRLVSRLDVLRFRSVCKNWRLALPSPTLFPLRVPPPPNCDPNVPYFMTEFNIYLNPYLTYVIESAGQDFMYMALEELDRGGRFACLLSINPFRWVIHDTRGEWFMGEHKNHPLSGLTFCGKTYLVCRSDYVQRASAQYSSPLLKVVVISSPNAEGVRVSSNAEGVNPSYVRVSDLSAVALLWEEPMRGRLAVLRLGGGGENWNWDTGFCSHVFEDIATYKGNLCAIDNSGSAFLMDYHSLQMTQITQAQDITPVAYWKRLFEVDGELYLVDISGVKEDALLFYKVDWQRREWVVASDFKRQFKRKYVAFGPTCHVT